jgi:uncharacterized protein YebE (UPF0316 family)
MNYLLLFFIGVLELFIGIVHFKFNQKNYKYGSAFLAIVYIYIWAYVLFNLFEDGHLNFLLVSAYALGSGVGNFIALQYDAKIEKLVLKIRKKGRKIKRGLLLTK